MGIRRDALVTGGTGALGSWLTRRLVADGYTVTVVARRPPQPNVLVPGVHYVAGDTRDHLRLRPIVPAGGVVFHLAGPRENSGGDGGDISATTIDGMRTVLDEATMAQVRRIIMFSTIHVYGPTCTDAWTDEACQLRPVGRYAEGKARAEQIAADRAQGTDVPEIVRLRIAAVYGPLVPGNLAMLLRYLRRGLVPAVPAPDVRRTVVHVRDVAAAAVLAAEHPTAAGRVFNVTDGRVHTVAEIVAAAAAALDRRPPGVGIPASYIHLAARLGKLVRRTVGLRPSPFLDALSRLATDSAVDGAALREALGFRPEFDLRAGWQDTVETLARDQ